MLWSKLCCREGSILIVCSYQTRTQVLPRTLRADEMRDLTNHLGRHHSAIPSEYIRQPHRTPNHRARNPKPEDRNPKSGRDQQPGKTPQRDPERVTPNPHPQTTKPETRNLRPRHDHLGRRHNVIPNDYIPNTQPHHTTNPRASTPKPETRDSKLETTNRKTGCDHPSRKTPTQFRTSVFQPQTPYTKLKPYPENRNLNLEGARGVRWGTWLWTEVLLSSCSCVEDYTARYSSQT